MVFPIRKERSVYGSDKATDNISADVFFLLVVMAKTSASWNGVCSTLNSHRMGLNERYTSAVNLMMLGR